LYIIAQSWRGSKHFDGVVVGTVMSNLGLEHALQSLGIEFKRAPVGDRYVMEMLSQGGWTLGGESSGHILCLDRMCTGDGIVSALQVLAAMIKSGKSLNDLKAGMKKYPQCMINVPIDKSFDFKADHLIQTVMHEVETELADTGRVLLRASGTEPVVRVMVEGVETGHVNDLANRIASTIIAAQESYLNPQQRHSKAV